MRHTSNGIVMAHLLLLSLVTDGAGQIGEVRLGLDAGLTLATFRGAAVEGLDTQTGASVGLTLDRQVHDLVWIGTGVGWAQKGATGTLTGFEEPLVTDLRLDYLQIPVLFGVGLAPDSRVRPTVFAGPAVAFEMSCDVRTAPEELAVTLGCPEDDSRRQTDWSAILGAGIGYDTGRALVRVTGRYDHGLTQLNDTEGGQFAQLHNRAFVIGAGVSVPIRR